MDKRVGNNLSRHYNANRVASDLVDNPRSWETSGGDGVIELNRSCTRFFLNLQCALICVHWMTLGGQ